MKLLVFDTISPGCIYPILYLYCIVVKVGEDKRIINKAVYLALANAIESLNMTLRKVIKNERVFPYDNSVFKVLFLAIGNASKNEPCLFTIGRRQ